MGRYLIILFLAFFYFMPSMVVGATETEEHSAGQRLLGIFAPKPGVWSEYAIFDKATGKRTVMHLSIVGIELDSYWYEMENRGDAGITIIKMLIKGDPIYTENIKRLIIKSGAGPAREIHGDFSFMIRQEAGWLLEQQSGVPVRATVNLKSVKTSEGNATVPAGTFDVSLHEIVDPAGIVHTRYKYSQAIRPFGIVSSETDTKTMVLVGYGTEAESLITEEPVVITEPPGIEGRGRIMQIPGMGTGYERKQ